MQKINIKILSAIIFLYFLVPVASRAAAYDFYVDKNSIELTENGNVLFPWKTIGAALSHIQSEGLKKKTVYIKNGTYFESLSVSNNTKLVGESKNGTIIDGTGSNHAVNLVSTKSEIKDLKIKNADATNIVVDRRSKATITGCNIEKAGKFGVEVKESSAAEKYKFTISNSKISENGSQGMFISKRKIKISDNEIFSNDEEGVDLHSRVKGTVAGNDIYGNGESGIESMLAGTNLTIRNNEVENNHAQGITIQVYSTGKKGRVKISGNTIRGNHKYGIRFANYTHSIGPKKFRVFADKYIKLSKNTISDNDSGKIFYE
ncbi:MAG: hypothetical protein A3J76_01680 [Candidatus Moranbacteria bacterium RBG_13_45_13]|nr:MAG: hypothetical protein A3J76_01680 [Candidatus Moranbacteria bacterium RBG_13_45_13]